MALPAQFTPGLIEPLMAYLRRFYPSQEYRPDGAAKNPPEGLLPKACRSDMQQAQYYSIVVLLMYCAKQSTEWTGLPLSYRRGRYHIHSRSMLLAAASPKRLSCDRCHAQKLRCSRRSSDANDSCVRCLRRGAECVYSMRLPKGRPRTKTVTAKAPIRDDAPTSAGLWLSNSQPNSIGPDAAFPNGQPPPVITDWPASTIHRNSDSLSFEAREWICKREPSYSCESCRQSRACCTGERSMVCQKDRGCGEYNPHMQQDIADAFELNVRLQSATQPPTHENHQQHDPWTDEFPISTPSSNEWALELIKTSASISCPRSGIESPRPIDYASAGGNGDVVMGEPVASDLDTSSYWQSQEREWSDAANAAQPWSAVLLQGVRQSTTAKTPAPPDPNKSANKIGGRKRQKLSGPNEKNQQPEVPGQPYPGLDDEGELLSTGYMGPGSSSGPRYVGSAFWALVHGQESLFDNFLDASQGRPQTTTSRNMDVASMATLLMHTPSKAVCDALLYSFLVSVRPVRPLIHVPTFRKCYTTFWRQFKHDKTYTPESDNLTFIPLLFSVLYCGAVAAPESFWSGAGPLAALDPGNTIDLLRSSYIKGLEICHYPKHHNLNTLVALLVGHGCSNFDNNACENLSAINMAVRIAQSMGIHRENSQVGIDPVTSEVRRRIWWYLISLDAQYSLWYGSQACCGIEGNQWNIQMVSETSDEAMQESEHRTSSASPNVNSTSTSMFMLFSIGRYEAARFVHGLLNRANSCHSLSQDDMSTYLEEFRSLHVKITALIDRMPAQGIPEQGFVPSRLVNASSLTHGSLYTEQSDEPSVFVSWARITLTMLMTGCLLNLQKIFLGHPSLTLESRAALWLSSFKLSITYIHHLVRIKRIPAFAPYFWFFTRNVFTFQAILIILSYLKQNYHTKDAQIACYFVDEALDIVETSNRRGSIPTSRGSGDAAHRERPKSELQAMWSLLKTMRMKLDAPTAEVQPTNNSIQSINRTSETEYTNSKTTTPPLAASSLRGQHLSTASAFPTSRQSSPHPRSPTSFSMGDGVAGFSLAFFPELENKRDGEFAADIGIGLDISELDLLSSTVLQGWDDIPAIERV